MKTITLLLEPIERRFAADRTVTFTPAAGGALPFPALTGVERLYAEFRIDPQKDTPAQAVVDSQNGSLAATGAGQLAFHLTAAQTALFATDVVFVSFAYRVGGVWKTIPARFRWPVIAPVTRPPA